MPRDLCESAKKGRTCIDSICRSNPDNTLCGFSQELYDEITADMEDRDVYIKLDGDEDDR